MFFSNTLDLLLKYGQIAARLFKKMVGRQGRQLLHRYLTYCRYIKQVSEVLTRQIVQVSSVQKSGTNLWRQKIPVVKELEPNMSLPRYPTKGAPRQPMAYYDQPQIVTLQIDKPKGEHFYFISSPLIHSSPSILTHKNLAVIFLINHYYCSLLPDHVGYLQNILALMHALVILLTHAHIIASLLD